MLPEHRCPVPAQHGFKLDKYESLLLKTYFLKQYVYKISFDQFHHRMLQLPKSNILSFTMFTHARSNTSAVLSQTRDGWPSGSFWRQDTRPPFCTVVHFVYDFQDGF
jgi:hypothetical protein